MTEEKIIGILFFLKQKTAYDIEYGLVGSEMCIRDSSRRRGEDARLREAGLRGGELGGGEALGASPALALIHI